MNKNIKYVIKALLALSILSLLSCQKQAAKKEVVGVLLRNDYEQYLADYKNGLIDFAKKNNIPIQVYSANNDAAIQIDQLKTLLLNGIKDFVIIAYNTDLTEQMVKIIKSQGGSAAFSNIIPSVTALKEGHNFFYASSPETDAGKFQAQIIDQYFKKNPDKLSGKNLRVVYFNGEYGHPGQIYRRIGVMDELSRLGYKVDVVADYGSSWMRENARQSMNLLIENGNSEFDVVIAQNDEMALGAIDSLVSHGLVDNPSNPSQDTDKDGTALAVPVLGVDATESGKASLSKNQMYGTVLQDANAQAATALELVWNCLKYGNAENFSTSSGIRPAKETSQEAPLTDRNVIGQCYIVPFVPVTK